MGRLVAGAGVTAPGPPRRQPSRRGPGRRFRPRQKRFPTGAPALGWTSRGAPGSSGRCAEINEKTLKYKKNWQKKFENKTQGKNISSLKDYSSTFIQKAKDRSKVVDLANKKSVKFGKVKK